MAENVLTFTDANFQTEVLNNQDLTIVDFWATWCQPCLRLAPTVEAIATEYSGKVRVGKLNTDENPQVSSDFRITGIPTLIFFKGGQQVGRLTGLVPKDKIVAEIDKAAAG